MNADPKRKLKFNDLISRQARAEPSGRSARRRSKETFPASDPVSIMISEQKGATEADRT